MVVLDSRNEILAESNQWAATPLAADDDWRGPIMPGSSRRFAVSHHGASPEFRLDELKTEVEITDVRVWNGGEEAPLIHDKALSAADESDLGLL
jgi:hypothetical protein